jgi:hypothetical protein|tara:strand:+ start:724 stop:918 length:195 start_codon:yes stop_codon:yes gene_type:complete
MTDQNNRGVGMLIDAMKEHDVSFKEALDAIAMAGNDKKFQKDLDEAYNVDIFDDWAHWQDDIAV